MADFGGVAEEFGDRPELEERRKKQREASTSDGCRQSKRRRFPPEEERLGLLTSTDEGFYLTKSKESRAAFEKLLSAVQQQLGGNVVSVAADDILAVLKISNLKTSDKKKEIEKLLNPISYQFFDQLVSIGDLITDFEDVGDAQAAANGDEVGVAVEFEDNGEEDYADKEREDDAMQDADDGGLTGQRQVLDLAADEELVRISTMPGAAQPAFKGLTHLNRVESRVYQTALFNVDNILFCAPIDAGKTNVAILTILHQIALNRNCKIVYLAPVKELVADAVGNLSKRFQEYDVKVKELSGDQTLTRQQIEESQIIVTTPEMWDLITRQSGDRTYTQLVKLLIIDEIHLLGDDNRGPVLESIVARTVRRIETSKEHIRLVGLSANVPNYEDVALFLRVNVEKGLFHFDCRNQQLPIESQLVSKLADQLNAEIVLGTVQNVKEACVWLRYTYLFVRMMRNPTLYGLPADAMPGESGEDLVRNMGDAANLYSADLVHSAATILEENNLVKYDRKSGYFQVTDLGRIASYYNITRGTIASYNEHLDPSMSDVELCRLFSLSEEFKNVKVRQDEKVELAKLLERLPIPIKESLDEPSAKIIVLLQAYISQLKLEGFSLTSDLVFITQSAERLMRALFEIAMEKGWVQLSQKALKWCKMINRRMWSGVQTPLRQFPGIPNELLMKLDKKDLAFERYYDLSIQEIGELMRFPQMGRTLHKFIHQFPKLNLAANVKPITKSVLRFELTVTPEFQWDDGVHGFVEPFWIIVEDNDGEYILHYEQFMVKKQCVDEDHILDFTVSIYEQLAPQYFIRVISDRWLGSQTILPVPLWNLILPEDCPPPTELLDLQPLPVTALGNPSYEALYTEFMHFNPVQTQVFNTLYNSDDNVLVAAPNGSGKTICAEFAILRNHQIMKSSESIMRAVYIAPVEALASRRYNEWKKKFGDGLGMLVVELTGVTTTDLVLLERGQIIISTSERWDALSRRWRHRKYVRMVSLFIADELHLIGDHGGSVLEVIVSRMRCISCNQGNRIRTIALSTSLADAKDFGRWIVSSLADAKDFGRCIEAPSHGVFNFPPSVGPEPLIIHTNQGGIGIDIADFEDRMMAMTKPTYTAIVQNAENGKPAIVFVPTRKHTRLTALDLMNYGRADMDRGTFLLQSSMEKFELFLEKINDHSLKETLRFGLGYLHEGLTRTDQDIVKTLFQTGWIQVCVMCSSMSWGVSLSANLVVIMGTRHNPNTDYLVSDLLQMMGHAKSGKCVIFCRASRREYYKKFLTEAFPVESQLQHYLHDNFNAEVAGGVIQNMQDAMDYLTWTFMYWRLTKNPNYYNLEGVTHWQVTYHLSELVSNTMSDLQGSKCVDVDDEDSSISPMNLGLMASYYYVSCETVQRFSSSLNSKTKLSRLLEILASAAEYDKFPMRPGEEELIRELMKNQRFSFSTSKNPKPHVLLEAHFSRKTVKGDLAIDQQEVVVSAIRLLEAMVDVCCSNGWLRQALLAMEVSQMVTQGIWERDSLLMQIPHFTNELAEKCAGKSIETVFDLAEMENDERRELLQMSESQLMDVGRFCNRVPNIDVEYDVEPEIFAGEKVTVSVRLRLDNDGGPRSEDGGGVHVAADAPRYPNAKREGWWLVIGDGDGDGNRLVAVRRVAFLDQRELKKEMDFEAPLEAGKKIYKLYFRSDSYLGFDQEYSFTIHVKEADPK